MPATLEELAARFGCRLEGPGDIVVERVATLAAADGSSVSFLANPLYRSQLATTRAAAVVLDAGSSDAFAGARLVSENPYAAYARIAAYLHPPRPVSAGIHASASVAPDAQVASSAEIGPLVSVGEGSRIGERAVIGAGTVIGAGVAIGDDTRIAPRVSVLDRVTIGARCIVHSGAVIGSDGFGFAQEKAGWVKVPQLGAVEIGDDVEIGANTTVDRGTIESTVIENGVKLDNLVQIAHNVRLGEHTVMAAMSGVAGSTKVGRRCMIAGGVVMIGHLEICDDAVFLFRSIVTKSVSAAGVYAGSLPAEEAKKWRRNAARFRNLDTMHRRLGSLEESLEELREKAFGPAAQEKAEDHD